MSFDLYHGDCLAILRTMPDNSIDSIVTDPPYGLSFMGKRWDYDVPGVEVWAECLRVLKPGGHLLAFAGTRTQHRMAVRIEDAGFEIRDLIAWVYGSGFPKSLDVSKAIDKARTEDVEPVRVICRVIRAAMDAKGLKSKHLVEHFNGCHPRLIDHWAARDTDSQPALPTWEQWETLREVLGIDAEHNDEVWRLNGRKGQPGDTWQNAEVIGEHQGQTPGFGEHRFEVRDNTIREASTAARQWQGWGTALKPALEPITVARKPLVGTVAANVLAHGTGAINIDGCRVPPGADHAEKCASVVGLSSNRNGNAYGEWAGERTDSYNTAGRFPANLIHDGSDEVVAQFPDSAGSGGSVPNVKISGYGDKNVGTGKSEYFGGERTKHNAGSGSAARFFYCAKASKKDRGEGNNHPTVKPTDLMAYLCRLVTPPGGVVFDPFMGSGTTGKAAMREGFRFIGCELSPEYLEIARARIAQAFEEFIVDLA